MPVTTQMSMHWNQLQAPFASCKWKRGMLHAFQCDIENTGNITCVFTWHGTALKHFLKINQVTG